MPWGHITAKPKAGELAGGLPGAEVQVVPGRSRAPRPASTCSLILGESPFFLCLGFLTCRDMNTFQRVTVYTGVMSSPSFLSPGPLQHPVTFPWELSLSSPCGSPGCSRRFRPHGTGHFRTQRRRREVCRVAAPSPPRVPFDLPPL